MNASSPFGSLPRSSSRHLFKLASEVPVLCLASCLSVLSISWHSLPRLLKYCWHNKHSSSFWQSKQHCDIVFLRWLTSMRGRSGLTDWPQTCSVWCFVLFFVPFFCFYSSSLTVATLPKMCLINFKSLPMMPSCFFSYLSESKWDNWTVEVGHK